MSLLRKLLGKMGSLKKTYPNLFESGEFSNRGTNIFLWNFIYKLEYCNDIACWVLKMNVACYTITIVREISFMDECSEEGDILTARKFKYIGRSNELERAIFG